MNQKLIQKKQPLGNELQLQLLISSEEIEKRLERVARDLEKRYENEEVTIVMIMKGSFVLIADLIRLLHLPSRLEYVQVSSYGERGIVKGTQEITGLDRIDVSGRHVLIIDDIFDTGETLAEIAEKIKAKGVSSLSSLVLLSKKVRRSTDYHPDITLFEIEDRFVVGYGLDYKEYYRGLPDIYAIER
ncbi:MAG: hypoxanthine phosphoribosyltransferase [Chlamydiia bacterium]|nr:hypoxanthine phosphoribosyltransferase [Chlamydiia bacterium]